MSHPPLTRRTRPTAFHDILSGAKLSKTWAFLSYQDLIARYRRSLFGPFWIAAVMGTQSLALALVFGTIYNIDIKVFLPYVVAGLSIIGFIGCAFGLGSSTFEIYKSLLLAHPLPISFHVFRMYCRHLIEFMHNILIFCIVCFICNGGINFSITFIPALLVASVFIFSTTLISATLSVRFADFKFMLPHVWTIVFYFTPIIWKTSQVRSGIEWVYMFNPIYYIVELLRSGMMGTPVSSSIWFGSLVTILCTSIVAYVLFSVMRKKITLWV